MPGCTNPGAVNYDPLETEDNGSCVYLEDINGVCHYFTDYDTDGILDRSFTLSYAIDSQSWVFFHTYIPDFYFHTREKLHPVKGRQIYTANEGEPGQFLNETKDSFFIDVVFNYKDEQTLNAINWISERMGASGQDSEFTTLTHITIWNNFQTTGRIPLSSIFNGNNVENSRRTKSKWSFNDFRDIVQTRGNLFLRDIFQDFAIITAETNSNMPWYKRKLLEDQYFIVRFEFDNSANNIVFLHDVEADTTRSER